MGLIGHKQMNAANFKENGYRRSFNKRMTKFCNGTKDLRNFTTELS
jgi:hypothetical protein